MKLVVGLGNPEERYAGVRHNLGFDILNAFVKKVDAGNWKIKEKFKSEILRYSQDDRDVLFVKPQTYMNNSGMAVKLLSTAYGLQPTDIIVIHDELDLPLGKIKVRLGGAAAGHHGVESIIKELGTDQFIRVRLGIGNLKTQSAEHKKGHVSAEKFVLEPFLHSEKSSVKHMIKQATKALDLLLEKGLPAGRQGLEAAQNQFN